MLTNDAWVCLLRLLLWLIQLSPTFDGGVFSAMCVNEVYNKVINNSLYLGPNNLVMFVVHTTMSNHRAIGVPPVGSTGTFLMAGVTGSGVVWQSWWLVVGGWWGVGDSLFRETG